jgi:hypothetical protein
MKNIAIAAVLFSLLVAPLPVSTQTKAPPKAQTPAQPAAAAPAQKSAQPAAAAPAQKSAPPAAPAAAAAPPEVKAQPMTRASHRVPSTADARVCLEFPTNLQIIKCADKYRWAS